MLSSYMQRFYPESRFGGFTNYDGTVAFYSRIHSLLEPQSIVLDIGCGHGKRQNDPSKLHSRLRDLRPHVRRVIGIDVDLSAASNPTLHEFRAIHNSGWPVENNSVDLAFSDYVLEHVQQPGEFFLECFRVLRPGGILCLRTVNVWGYVGLIARLIPNRHHFSVLKRVSAPRQEAYPTFYRCNTLRSLRRILGQTGFDAVVWSIDSEPHYVDFGVWAYALGVLYQRYALASFRNNLIAFARKPVAV